MSVTAAGEPRLSDLGEDERRVALRAAARAAGSKLERDAPERTGRVDRRRAVGRARAPRGERRRGSGDGGALPVHASAAPPAPPAHRLRHRAADRRSHRRVLPLAPPRRHSAPRAGAPASGGDGRRLCAAAGREAPGATTRARRDPGAHPRPLPLPPRAVHHHDRRARSGTRSRHPALRDRPAAPPSRHEDRMPAAFRRGRCRPPAGAREHP